MKTDQVIIPESPATKTITKEDIIKLVAKRYPFLESAGFEPEFGFLKYNATLEGGLTRFMVYQADPYSKTFVNKQGSTMFHEGQYGPIAFSEAEYLSEETSDRFVWIFFGPPLPLSDQYYFDASDGKLVAILHSGAYCHGCKEGK